MQTKNSIVTPVLPVDPYPWRHLPINFALLVASWAALLAWLYGGSEGAGNLYMAWVWFWAVVCTIGAVATKKRLSHGAPWALRHFFRLSSVIQVALLAWFGCWWLFAAGFWTLFIVVADRDRTNRRIAAQQSSGL